MRQDAAEELARLKKAWESQTSELQLSLADMKLEKERAVTELEGQNRALGVAERSATDMAQELATSKQQSRQEIEALMRHARACKVPARLHGHAYTRHNYPGKGACNVWMRVHAGHNHIGHDCVAYTAVCESGQAFVQPTAMHTSTCAC